MDTGFDGGVPIGHAGGVGAICLQLGQELLVKGFGLSIALGAVGGCQPVRDALELVHESEEIIVIAPVTVRDNDSGNTMNTVKFVVEGLGQLMLAHRQLARDRLGELGQPICEVETEVVTPGGERLGPDSVEDNLFKRVFE
jgi:hypothetical protein